MVKIIRGQFYFFLAFVLLLVSGAALSEDKTAQPEVQHILGWVEPIRLEPWGLKMRARLDTGANTSSMSARDIHQFKKGSKDWVRFILDFKTDKGKPNRTVEIERPVMRTIKIKRHSGISQERQVVQMDLCLANEVRTIEFNLIDRRALNYPILLGRKALANFALVDSGRIYLSKSDCGHVKKRKKKQNNLENSVTPE